MMMGTNRLVYFGSPMDYHYRFLANEQCEILCTRCFLKIGEGATPGQARAQAEKHLCPFAPGPRLPLRPSIYEQTEAVRARFLMREAFRIPAPILILFAVSACYGLPTVMEWAILRYANLWMGAVFMGDLCGCIAIFVVLKRRRLAVTLYLALTAAEWWLCAAQVVSTQALVLLMDAVPTAILATAILRPRGLALAKR
jgi:hypothetical protein